MKILFAATLAVSLIATGGCASRPTMPDWVNGPAEKYPSEQYLVGRGQAATAEEARDRARADLAKIFEVAVAVESEDIQTFRRKSDSAAKDAKPASEYAAQASRRLTTRADHLIEGIQIAEVWQDPLTRTQHALAVLPRLQASMRLRQEIERLDAATRKYLDESRTAADILMKIGAAQHALEAQMKRAGYQKSLRIVDPTGRGAESEWNTARLNADLADLLRRVRVAVQTAPDAPPGFAAAVSGAVAGAGFLIATGEKPEYVLVANLALEDLGLRDGWYWQRGALEVTLREVAANRVRGSRRWDIKVSAQDRAVSRQRALDQAAALLKKDLRETLTGFARP
ncbi:MAG: LPP20 family lipoprotein [Sulfuricaulis sp.]|nr:LPP20 family lipoprotein [Sulfuricaulis sp.]